MSRPAVALSHQSLFRSSMHLRRIHRNPIPAACLQISRVSETAPNWLFEDASLYEKLRVAELMAAPAF